MVPFEEVCRRAARRQAHSFDGGVRGEEPLEVVRSRIRLNVAIEAAGLVEVAVVVLAVVVVAVAVVAVVAAAVAVVSKDQTPVQQHDHELLAPFRTRQ